MCVGCYAKSGEALMKSDDSKDYKINETYETSNT